MSLLSQVRTSAQMLPSRVFLYAREKWGKSSLFAHAPGVIFFMTRGETGLLELIGGNRVPPTPHFPYDESDPPTWETLRRAVRELIEAEHPYRLLVVDTCNGAEVLCQDFVRRTKFRNSQKAFASFGKGWDECRVEWLDLMQDLDELRARRKVGVVLLAHTRVKKFDDPTAEEAYDQYQPACQDKLWDLTARWADVICFGHFLAETFESESGRTKAKSTVRRVVCFDQSPLWAAGNRYGLAGQVDVSRGAAAGWKAFRDAMVAARSSGRGTDPTPPAGDGGSPTTPPAPSAPTGTGADPRPAPTDPKPEPKAEPPAARPAPEPLPDDTAGTRAVAVMEALRFADMTWGDARAEFAEALGLDAACRKPVHLTADQAQKLILMLRDLVPAGR